MNANPETESDRKRTTVEDLNERAGQNTGIAENIASRLYALRTRLVGDAPTEVISKDPSPRMGALGNLEDTIDQTNRNLRDAQDTLTYLEDFV